MKSHEFDRVIKKLEMETRDTSHLHCWLVHNGVTVVRTMRSHGTQKYVPEHLIRKQLHVTQEQFVGLHSCTVSKQEYINILINKGVIANKEEPEESTKPKEATTKSRTPSTKKLQD